MCKRILGRMRETKVIDTELNWLYSVLIDRQPIDPTHLMINWWYCDAPGFHPGSLTLAIGSTELT
jgi:hypothetical protein